ncbi:MAG: phosphatase PAP2 family protein [Bacteroidales bacterium]|nr:phosphatase PAP2 family protein [Bacteroidales bacterium]
MNYRLKVLNIRYLTVEKLTFAYILITSLIIVITRYGTYSGFELLKYRLIIACIIIALAYVNNIKDWWIIRILRVAFIGGLLSYWYPETYEINRVLPNFDFILANLEQNIFGFQPALVFSKHFTQLWFSELMNMGYFSYYPLIIGTALYFYFANPKYFGLFFFTVLFSFYLYYIIYIIFPTAGPQYYYYAIGMDNALSGNFPDVGYYFNYHNTLLANQDNSGYFYHLVENTQLLGERPTAAFPSSHVGISTIIMIMVARYKRYFVFELLFPIYLILVASTVYIQAHYFVDVLTGFISAFVFCFLSVAIYEKINRIEMFRYIKP